MVKILRIMGAIFDSQAGDFMVEYSSSNYIKSDRVLETLCHPFSTYDRGVDTMSDHTPTQPKTKEIPLTQGQVAIVDAADFEWLSQWKWYAHSASHLWYACRKEYDDTGKRYMLGMHRAILGAPGEMEVDHINGDGLDNRRKNLRFATRTQNNHNRRTNRNNRSGFKGVSWDSTYGKWRVMASFGGKQQHVGYFDDPIKAAFARDVVELKHHGEFASLNFPEAANA